VGDLSFIMVAVPSVVILALAMFILFFRFIKKRRFVKSRQVPLTDGILDSGNGVGAKILQLLSRGDADDDFFSEMERVLLEADVGIEVTSKLLLNVKKLSSMSEVRDALKNSMVDVLYETGVCDRKCFKSPHVVLIVGVNGVGKTTTIAKLANRYLRTGKKVLLVAGDTFRAAAVEQLKVWGERLGCETFARETGADCASVAFDGVSKASSRGFDVVIIDTAGRLHTKLNLMEELKKIERVIGKALEGAPHEKIIVIDATVGSNGLVQAREFNDAMGLTGAVVTKLDGTAKGGIIFAISGELGIPVTDIGMGEGMEDLRPFDPRGFVDSIIP